MNLPLPCQWPCDSYFCVQGSQEHIYIYCHSSWRNTTSDLH